MAKNLSKRDSRTNNHSRTYAAVNYCRGQTNLSGVVRWKFLAIQDKCTHHESLSKGRINYRRKIVCPFHGFRFDLNSGMACDSVRHDLATYPIKSDDSGFFIGV
jgi:nitrite reductase/ring-hydroxylating ferredoxin subunit